MRYRAVVFDLFGTLVPYVGEEEFRDSLDPTAAALGCTVEQLEREWCTEKAFLAAITTMQSASKRIEHLCRNLSLKVDADALAHATETRLQAHRSWLCPLPVFRHVPAVVSKTPRKEQQARFPFGFGNLPHPRFHPGISICRPRTCFDSCFSPPPCNANTSQADSRCGKAART